MMSDGYHFKFTDSLLLNNCKCDFVVLYYYTTQFILILLHYTCVNVMGYFVLQYEVIIAKAIQG